MEKDTRGIGDNSKQETNYKSLFENLISMILESKIDVDTYLKDCIDWKSENFHKNCIDL